MEINLVYKDGTFAPEILDEIKKGHIKMGGIYYLEPANSKVHKVPVNVRRIKTRELLEQKKQLLKMKKVQQIEDSFYQEKSR